MENKKSNSVKDIVTIGLIAAVIFASVYISIPISGATMVKASIIMVVAFSIAFGGKIASIGCGLGAMLFDVSSQWITYAPFSLIAYGAMAFIIGKMLETNYTRKKAILWSFVGVTIQILVYVVPNVMFSGKAYALASILPEYISGIIGMAVGIPLGEQFKKILPKISNR